MSGLTSFAEYLTGSSHAQGGGVVKWDELQYAWIFVADPPEGYSIGDFMPEDWGIAG